MNQTLIALKDDQWKRVRHIVTPTFSTGKIKMVMILKVYNFIVIMLEVMKYED
jgi:hypothetical protein